MQRIRGGLMPGNGAAAERWADGRMVVRFGLVSALFSVGYLLVMGLFTAVIPNPWFVRMTSVTGSNVVFWILPGLLFGLLAGSYVAPLAKAACDVGNRTMAGGLLSFLAVGCPICNKVVVLALGVSGALTYFEPIQPLLGLGSVILLGYAVWLRVARPLLTPTPR